MLTDDEQNVVWEAEYAPFGKATETVTIVEQNLRFPGQYLDRETGLHYNYFRTYDPQIGRYLESDPIGLRGGINTYIYVGANPLTYVDPEGLTGLSTVISGTAAAVATCLRYPRLCTAIGTAVASSVCQLAGGCKIPDVVRNDDASQSEEGGECPIDGSPQDKKLTKGETKKLIDGGVHPHELKDGSR